jgi:hypothetical protein
MATDCQKTVPVPGEFGVKPVAGQYDLCRPARIQSWV